MAFHRIVLCLLIVILFPLNSCTQGHSSSVTTSVTDTPDTEIRNLSLSGVWADPEREYSGAAVFKQSVVLLPQYPERSGNQIPSFSVTDLLAQHQGETPAPSFLEFDDGGLSATIAGFEGFEALAFSGEDVFVSVESHQPSRMMGYLVRGKVHEKADGLRRIELEKGSRVELPPRANLGNMSDEAIVLLPRARLLTFYEANGANAVPRPTAYLFDVSNSAIRKIADIPMPHIEYRITDCTPADDQGYFWCINYMWPGDEQKLRPAPDEFARKWNVSLSQSEAWHSGSRRVERLVQLHFDGKEITAGKERPLYLKLPRGAAARNWEGIAYVPDRGFFVATDKFPQTLFAFLSTK